eukprot:scaffold5972_cov127-Cylindrotheca_fusiformis.AAC.1
MRQSIVNAVAFITALRSAKLSTALTVEPTLPIGEINVVVLTDVHSWVAGHGRQEPQLNADYGDVLSFYERLKEHCDEHGHDLWFVSNGDFVDGTGLSAPSDPSSLIPIIQKLPLDALNCGNHELYLEETVDYMMRPGGWVDWWGDRYLTGNIKVSREGQKRPLGHLYRYLEGNQSNLLVYGFLYNMKGACESVDVEEVEVVLQMPWFREALVLEGEHAVDAVLVLAHMDLKDPLVDVIRKAIRDIAGAEMPIQFITGHTHYRGETQLDDWSTSFEAGRYLDTIGFVSFPTRATAELTINATNSTNGKFQSVFIDGSAAALSEHLGLDDPKEMETQNGIELSTFVRSTREKMGLLEDIGCAPHDYIVNAALDDEASLWRLFRDEVIPKTFFVDEKNGSIMFLRNEAWRYDLRSHSSLILDDIIAVAPFNDTVMYIGSVPGRAILRLNETMNGEPFSWSGLLPNFILIGAVDDEDKLFHFYAHEFNAREIIEGLQKIIPDSTFVAERTPFSSTMLWVAYVGENWPCNGKQGKLPDWIPTPESVAKQLGKEDDESAKKVISVITAVVLGIMLVLVLRCCYAASKNILGGFNPVLQDELEDLKTAEEPEKLDEGEEDRWDGDFIEVDKTEGEENGDHFGKNLEIL